MISGNSWFTVVITVSNWTTTVNVIWSEYTFQQFYEFNSYSLNIIMTHHIWSCHTLTTAPITSGSLFTRTISSSSAFFNRSEANRPDETLVSNWFTTFPTYYTEWKPGPTLWASLPVLGVILPWSTQARKCETTLYKTAQSSKALSQPEWFLHSGG